MRGFNRLHVSPCKSLEHMRNSRLLLRDLGQLFLDHLVGRAHSHAREVDLPHRVVGRVEGCDGRLGEQVRFINLTIYLITDTTLTFSFHFAQMG